MFGLLSYGGISLWLFHIFQGFSHNYTLPWVNCHSGVITFVSSIVLNLFNANLSSFKLVSRTNLIYKKQFRIFFLVCQPLFKSFFVNVCFLFVGVAGLEPAKESELQRLPPYQLGYTPRIRPLLNYQLLAFLGLVSVLALSQWDSNPSLRLACRYLTQ